MMHVQAGIGKGALVPRNGRTNVGRCRRKAETRPVGRVFLDRHCFISRKVQATRRNTYGNVIRHSGKESRFVPGQFATGRVSASCEYLSKLIGGSDGRTPSLPVGFLPFVINYLTCDPTKMELFVLPLVRPLFHVLDLGLLVGDDRTGEFF